MPRVAKKSTSFVNAAFMTSGAPATMGQLALSIVSVTKLGTCVRMGKKMYLSGFLSRRVRVEEQVVDVRLRDLARVAGVDRAVLAALDPHLLGGLVAEDDVLLRDAERLEVRPEERRRSSRG